MATNSTSRLHKTSHTNNRWIKINQLYNKLLSQVRYFLSSTRKKNTLRTYNFLEVFLSNLTNHSRIKSHLQLYKQRRKHYR